MKYVSFDCPYFCALSLARNDGGMIESVQKNISLTLCLS